MMIKNLKSLEKFLGRLKLTVFTRDASPTIMKLTSQARTVEKVCYHQNLRRIPTGVGAIIQQSDISPIVSSIVLNVPD